MEKPIVTKWKRQVKAKVFVKRFSRLIIARQETASICKLQKH